MMKNLRVICLLIILSITKEIKAQSANLGIGSKLPNFKITNIINSNKKSFSSADIENQLLIIDFWATSCSGCVAALPKLDSIQKKFGDRIKILPVTFEPKEYTSDFWRNNKLTRHLSLPTVTDDKLFERWFIHKTIPHEVWVYKNIVIGITDEQYVDESNIKMILDGFTPSWPIKNDFFTVDRSIPIFEIDKNQVGDTYVRYSAISGYKENVNAEGLSGGSGIIRDATKKTVRSYFFNQPIYNSYNALFINLIKSLKLEKPSLYIQPNDLIWEVKDRSKYIYKNNGYLQEWLRQHSICFEYLDIDLGQTDEEIYKIMLSELNSLLGLNVRWERRTEKVLVITKSKSKRKVLDSLFIQDRGIRKSYKISDITYLMNQEEDNPFVYNRSNDDNHEIFVNLSSWKDLSSLKAALEENGFDLVEEQKEVDKLVFSEIDGGLITEK